VHVPEASVQVVAAVDPPSRYRDTTPEAAVGVTDAVPVKAEPSIRLALLVKLSVVVVEACEMLTLIPLERLALLLLSPP
jgi:hypothetical protein